MNAKGKTSGSARPSLWEKVQMGEAAKWEQEDLKTAIHWFRQALSFVMGFLFGLIPFTGFNAFMTHLMLNTVGTIVFYTSVMRIDPEEFGGHGVLAQEGMGPCISMFLLAWIVSYSLFQF